MPEEIEVVVEEGEVKAFYSNKGEKAFKKHLTKKGYVKERGFKQLVSLFKEEVERRGWKTVSQHMEPGRRVLVKEFYANLGEQKDLTCYVKGRWIPFREKAISQILGLKQVRECAEHEQLQKSPCFEEIAQELTNGLGQGQRTKTIRNAYIDIGDLTETNKVWFYLINSVFKPSKHVSTVRHDRTLLLYALVKGFELDLGKIIKEVILDYVENNFSGNIPHPALITFLCIKGGGGVGNKSSRRGREEPEGLSSHSY